MWWLWLCLLIGAYLMGSIPSAYLLVKLSKGIDIRKVGSGNIGSTNTVRVAGPWAGIAVFLMDSLKGVIPAVVGLFLGGEDLAMAAGLVAFFGHLFPLWLHFKGGKGVATAIGVAFVLLPWGALITFAFWFAMVLVSGYVSLASCAAGVMLVIISLCSDNSLFVNVLIVIMIASVIIKHRSNFRNIKNGTEGRAFRPK